MKKTALATMPILALALTACGSNGTSGSAPDSEVGPAAVATSPSTLGVPPTSVAPSPTESIDLVVIGDSFVAWSTWPELYSSMMEAATGTPVELHTDLAVAGVGPRLGVIKETDSALKLIRDAEAIVLQPEPGAAGDAWNAYFGDECGGDDGLQCFRDAAKEHRDFVDEYLDLIVENAQPGTIVRVALTYTWPVDGFRPSLREDDPESFSVLIDGLIAMKEQAESSAREHSIPTIDVGAAFNGPGYRDLAPAEYLWSDRVHLADEGSQVVANLLHELGYEATLAP